MDFETCAQSMRDKNKKMKLSSDQKGQIYGLYKQATCGDNTSTAPSFVQLEAKAKWKAWENEKGKSQDDAKKAYIDFCTALLN
eukprot:CAMPEP_0194129276 /NCGR_PEP_ID=MMETSP0152-20130528/516_1 /TAXON_ID=1049557 /ORGANISM="Thalassiothrix antarctica, Strain L6-D1" /LENGTH=82 /DNA_ID=CAMNT_0038823413 /DNA_START=49 /DNA_END=297 /DNA_ORIENTATION=+